MKKTSFFAIISRMKYINRWGLMNNTRTENLCDHSIDTAVIAHALCVLRNVRFGGNTNPERAALLAIYHDTGEIITGDLPTPVKYFNPEIKQAYKEIENHASVSLLNRLPNDLKPTYKSILCPDNSEKELWQLVKAADKLSALIKCTEELRMGNNEFASAEKSTRKALKAMNIPEVTVFMEEMLPAYSLNLDQQE